MTRTVPTTPQSETSFTDTTTVDVRLKHVRLNHPKNYLAVPLAIAASGNTDGLISEHAVDMPETARNGAVELGLLTESGEPTSLADAVIVTGTRDHGSPEAALESFESLQRSPKRFVEALPSWSAIAERVAFQYTPTEHLVKFLRQQGPLSLNEITWLLWNEDPELAESVFLHRDVTEQGELASLSKPTVTVLTDESWYQSNTPFQYKNFLYHSGIVESRGDYTTRLDPENDQWKLSPQFD